ncbi:DoxX family protein [Actinomadura napierensis]|uniref:DoxX family protein n=1 Tax=Actinomadura napierensis TaxID=267854 RepID=A0ABP5M999_9ACTN
MTDSSRATRRLVALMAGMGAAHMIAPRPFDAIIPKGLPGSPRTWTYLSGAAELACAAAVAYPRTRRAGALATAGLMAAVFPANVKMAHDWRDKPLPLRAAAYGRLPFQAPLIAWAVHVSRKAG